MKYTATIYSNAPSKSNSYEIIKLKNKKGGYYSSLKKSEAVKMFETFVQSCLSNDFKAAKIDKPFKLELDVTFRNKASDLDGCTKSILDSLQYSGAITNDSLCYELNLKKKVNREDPKIILTLTIL